MGNVSGILDGASAAARVTCAFGGRSLTYLEGRTMKEKERWWLFRIRCHRTMQHVRWSQIPTGAGYSDGCRSTGSLLPLSKVHSAAVQWYLLSVIITRTSLHLHFLSDHRMEMKSREASGWTSWWGICVFEVKNEPLSSYIKPTGMRSPSTVLFQWKTKQSQEGSWEQQARLQFQDCSLSRSARVLKINLTKQVYVCTK